MFAIMRVLDDGDDGDDDGDGEMVSSFRRRREVGID